MLQDVKDRVKYYLDIDFCKKYMKKRNLIILGIVCVVVIIGVSAYLLLRQEPVPNNNVITRIMEKEEEIIIDDPVVDEVHLPLAPFQLTVTSFCAKLITEIQFREITKYRDNLFFQDIIQEHPRIGTVKICNIDTIEPAPLREGELEIGIEGVSISVFPLEFSYEQAKQTVLAKFAEEPELKDEIKEIDNVGARAFGISKEVFHSIIFLEQDTNQVIEVSISGFTYDILIELARQIEMNVR